MTTTAPPLPGSHVPVDDARRLLSLHDLTDPTQVGPGQPPHAVQLAADEIVAALAATGVPVHRHRTNPVVAVADNYDRLGYPPVTEDDLEAQIRTVVTAALPGMPQRTIPAVHPYTRAGRQIEVADERGAWIEIGECV